jgi:serine/threonine-protein kinase
MTELPTTFGKYFLTEKLATGGMAEIYLAKLMGPGGFEKQLVIKQIHPKLTGQRHFVDLFVAEAKTLVTLAHGNIVPVYELGVIDDRYFIAMEYIDGPTLYRLTEALARSGDRMDPAVAAWITAKILEGLDYAHRKGEGVIHRDLSPRNVMLSRDGEVKLVDFGIAVTLGEADDGVEVQSAPTGSFPYMSPEQVRREPLTGQTDLFSVGVLLWEMLVGHRLFARADPDATLAAVTDGDIARPSSELPEIPAKLDEVAMRALERDQTSRWGSAADMLAALQRYLYGLDATPGPREIAALVARYCPPETRRMPTHADPIPGDDGAPLAMPGGPRTAVIDRDRAPSGKKQRARTETFATHVDLKSILQRATPLFPIAAINDQQGNDQQANDQQGNTQQESTPPEDSEPRAPAASTRMASIRPDSEPVDSDEPAPRSSTRLKSIRPDEALSKIHPEMPKIEIPGRKAPSRAFLVIAAIGAVVLGLGAIYVFMRGRAAVLRPDAPFHDDAPGYTFEPGTRDSVVVAVVDADDEAPLIDAAIDAKGAEPTHDSGPRTKPDGGTRPDAVTVVAGKAKLEVGADPWGDVVIDGIPQSKRAPSSYDVTAGHHNVDVIFKGVDPPLKKSFQVDLAADETKHIQADFK